MQNVTNFWELIIPKVLIILLDMKQDFRDVRAKCSILHKNYKGNGP